jgi:serine/threonine-protein phosphatase 5
VAPIEEVAAATAGFYCACPCLERPFDLNRITCADAQAIAVGETESASQRCITAIAQGACTLDVKTANVPLPTIPDDPTQRYTPTLEFVEGMIECFKNGGAMPKRVVWEIVLGVLDVVQKEKSLVEVTVPEGVTCDIVGDSELLSIWC